MSYRPFYWEARGVLEAETAVHVGTGEGWHPATDRPIARSQDEGKEGLAVIPGSSLKGVMRAYLTRECGAWGIGAEVVERLFGTASGENGGAQGRLSVWDAVAEGLGEERIRDHVRLEEMWGAAAEGGKFDEEVVEQGNTFEFRCVYEGEGEGDAELKLLREGLRALEEGRLRVGAAAGRGYGRVKLSGMRYWHFQRKEEAGLKGYLGYRLGNEAATGWECRDEPAGRQTQATETVVAWRIVITVEGPALVKATLPPKAEDGEVKWKHADAIYQAMGGKAYIPGSSIRGMLRHRAQRIARTVLRDDRLVKELFGEAKGDAGQRGKLEVDDAWVKTARPLYMDHVALDRITGFVAGSKKFAAVALESPEVEVTMRVRLGKENRAMMGLWRMLLRDLEGGYRLALGSGGSKGYGWITGAKVEEVTVERGGWPWEAVKEDWLGQLRKAERP